MPNNVDPDEIEVTDPNLELDASTFRRAVESERSTVGGLILIVKEGVARTLRETTIPNKGWEPVAKPYEELVPPSGYEALLFKTGTYRVKNYTSGPNLEIEVRRSSESPAAEGSSNGFAVPMKNVYLVYAYNEGKILVAPR
jgi:hypothetical protein